MESVKPATSVHGGIDWTVAPEWRQTITGPDAPDWSGLASDARATLVKSNPNRLVWRVVIGDKTIYVKEFRCTSLSATIRHLWRGSEASIEWRAGRAAAERSVRCVRFVACGGGRKRSFLISESLEGAVPLSESWLTKCHMDDTSERRRRIEALLDSVASLLAQAHTAGFLHGDDHPRNILIVDANDGAPTAFYTDVARATCTNAVTRKQAIRSLAQLRQWFRRRTTRAQRLRFLRTYGRSRSDGQYVMRQWAPAILAESAKQARRLWAKRDARITTTNRYFANLRLDDGSRAAVTLTFRQRDLFPTPTIPDQTIEQWRDTLHDTSSLDGFSVRHMRPNGIIERLRWLLFGSPLKRVFVAGHRLRNRDLPCRWAMAYVERSAYGTLLCDAQPVTEDLATFMSRSDMDSRERRLVCSSLANLVSLMCEAGVSIPRVSARTFGVERATCRVIIDDPSGAVIDAGRASRDRLAMTHSVYAALGIARWEPCLKERPMISNETWERISLVRDDITTMKVDAIVNAANASLRGGGGVDGAIHRAAGRELLKACKQLGRCPTGSAKITPGFKLPASHVIHAVGPRYRNGRRGEPEQLSSCYRTSIELAAKHDCDTVAFSGISCGIYGYPLAEAARISLETVATELEQRPKPRRVIWALLDPKVFQAFTEVLSELRSRA